jgi:hypothetical protein
MFLGIRAPLLYPVGPIVAVGRGGTAYRFANHLSAIALHDQQNQHNQPSAASCCQRLAGFSPKISLSQTGQPGQKVLNINTLATSLEGMGSHFSRVTLGPLATGVIEIDVEAVMRFIEIATPRHCGASER